MGTALLALALSFVFLPRLGTTGSRLILAAGLLYLIGVFGVTVAGNVPLNDGLAKLNPDSPETAAYWTKYLSTWTNWNHVRTVCAAVATVLYALALRSMPEA